MRAQSNRCGRLGGRGAGRLGLGGDLAREALRLAPRHAQADVQRGGGVTPREPAGEQPLAAAAGCRPRALPRPAAHEVDHHGDLAACARPAPRPALGHLPLTELKRGAAGDLLVDLGQLAAYRDAHIWRERRQNCEAARQTRRGLEGDHQAAAPAPALELRLQVAGRRGR